MFIVQWNKCPITGSWKKSKEFDSEHEMVDFITDHLTPTKQKFKVVTKDN